MIKDIAHIALNPLDMDRTVAYFDNVFGWKKVFEPHKDNGDPWIVYLKICKGHFLELFYDGKNDRDYAFDFRKTGYKEPKTSSDKNWQAWIHDPDGNKVELMMIDPESPQALA